MSNYYIDAKINTEGSARGIDRGGAEEEHDLELQKRFKTLSELHNGDKPILILDVDNTMVYVRFFSEEMQVNDIVTYFGAESVSKNNGKVVEVRLTLSLDISHNTLIDKVGSEPQTTNCSRNIKRKTVYLSMKWRAERALDVRSAKWK